MRVVCADDYIMAADTLFQETREIIVENFADEEEIALLVASLIGNVVHKIGYDLFGDEEYQAALTKRKKELGISDDV